MKHYIIIIAVIFIIFGGCTAHRKILKTQSETKIEKAIDSNTEISDITRSVKIGKTTSNETSTVEEISIKKPMDIELTANFRVDSTAFLRGDTALKLVDITDKNVSITIYQNGKTKVLTAKIKTLAGTQDVPFSEINIKKSTSTKSVNIDTTKTDSSSLVLKTKYIDKSKIETSSSTVNKDISRANYLWLVLSVILIIGLLWWINRK